MPANLVHNKEEEAAWERAKRAAHSQYDFSEENDRFWKIVNHIYQNMKALDAMDAIDEDGDAALHRTGSSQFAKARPLVGLVRTSPRLLYAVQPISKAYVRAHERHLPNGRVVMIPAYFTKRVAKPHEEGAKERKPRATKQGPSPRVHPGQTHEQLAHRLMRHVTEGKLTHAEAEANLAHLERRAHAGHHLEHGHGPAWSPEETHSFIAHARGRLAEHKAGQEREKETREQQASREAEAAFQERRRRTQEAYAERQKQAQEQEVQQQQASREAEAAFQERRRRTQEAYAERQKQGKQPAQDAIEHVYGEQHQQQQAHEQQREQGKPTGLTHREQQAAWDERMRQKQQGEREKQTQEQAKPQPTPRRQRHREQVQQLLAQRRAMGKSLIFVLRLRSA